MIIARKRFGQHFLHDQAVIDKLCLHIAARPGDILVEIGPGLGALTTALLPVVKKMQAIEIDRDIIPKLRKKCQFLGELNIQQMDVLTCDFSTLAAGRKLRIVGNLPYNISTPLLFHLFHYIHDIQDMYFMLQQEVVDRLAAAVNTENYGRLSVMVQYHCQVEPLFSVSPQAFNPAPRVDSAVVHLVPHKTPILANDVDVLEKVVRIAFQQRRKTIRNSLKTLINTDNLVALALDPNQRPANLTVQDYVHISNFLSDEGNKI